MRKNEIKVNGVYGALSPSNPPDFDCHPLPERTVCAIFNSTVLYSIQTGAHSWDHTFKTCSLRAFARWAQWESEVAENDQWAFLDKCRQVVSRLGKGWDDADRKAQVRILIGNGYGDDQFPKHTGRVYMDDDIIIVTSALNGTMNITKRENKNPVVYTHATGKPYRYHGEYAHLRAHVDGLLAA